MLKGVRSVVLGLEDVSAGRRFYADFGLAETEHGAQSATFQTQDESTIVLRSSEAAGLPPPVCSGSTVREIVWSAETAEDLENIAAELSKDRPVHRDADGDLHSLDEDGYGIAFRLDRRKAYTPPRNRTNVFGAAPSRPINSTIDFHEAVKPAGIGHVVIMSSDVAKAERFYVERLGFRVSDRFKDAVGVFLRPPGSNYHHAIFIIRGPLGLNHIAFNVRDFTDVMNGGVSLLKSGWEPQWGPGRHIFGANYFWYFNSPCGGAMELTADMDMVDDNWQPREVTMSAETGQAWSMTVKAPKAAS